MADDALTTNGKNRLGKSLSDVVSTAGLYLGKKKKLSNHSLRKTSIGGLLDPNFPKTM